MQSFLPAAITDMSFFLLRIGCSCCRTLSISKFLLTLAEDLHVSVCILSRFSTGYVNYGVGSCLPLQPDQRQALLCLLMSPHIHELFVSLNTHRPYLSFPLAQDSYFVLSVYLSTKLAPS